MAARYTGLDLLRITGAAIVVAHHFPAVVIGLAPRSAHLCVDLFFMLSGFVVATAYQRQLQQAGATRAFLCDRLVRFWPLHACALVLGALLASYALALNRHYMSVDEPIATLVAGLFFIPSGLGYAFALNPPAWSLAFEILINVAYAFASRHLSKKALKITAAVTAILFAKTVIAHGTADVGADYDTLLAGLSRIAYDFAAGLLIAAFAKNRRPARWLASGAMLAAMVMPLFRSGNGATYDMAYLGFVAPFAIWARPELSERVRPFVRYTFPAYILHYPVLFACERIVDAAGIDDAVSRALCLIAGLCAACWIGAEIAEGARRKLSPAQSAGADLPAPSFKSAKSIVLPATGAMAVNVRTQPVTSPGKGIGIVTGA